MLPREAETGPSSRARSLPTILFVAFAALLVAGAGLLMFSVFMFYDDEGYVLNSLRNFALHGHLYREVYSQYGPFPYALYYLLHLGGFPFTHTAGRLLSLTAWGGCALASAAILWRDTRNQAARLAVLSAVFIYLWIMVSEPTHPGGLIALVTALMAWAGHASILDGKIARWAKIAGVGAAILLLTKINVGGFAALSAVAWFLVYRATGPLRRAAPFVLLAGAILLPLGLMRSLIQLEWVQTYAILFACTAAAAVGAIARTKVDDTEERVIRVATIWGAATGTAILAVVMLRGTSVAEMINGILLGPLRHPTSFSLGFSWPVGVQAGALVSLGSFVAAWMARRRGTAWADNGIAVARIALALLFGVLLAQFPRTSPDNLTLAFVLPWLWLFLWPLAGEERARVAARSWVGLLVLGQCLHGFPVRGSQTAWGTFLLIPVVALGAWQGGQWLHQRLTVRVRAWRFAGLAAEALLIVFACVTSFSLWQVNRLRYDDGRYLHLPGAERIRLPDNASALFQLLTLNAAAHGDVLFSLPGMFSFNLWSGLPTPTLANVTHWFSLLSREQQLATIRALEAHPRACVIVQREHVEYLTQRGFTPSGPLHDYIRDNFVPAFMIDRFEFCVRKDRRILPLQVGELFTRSPETAATAGAKDSLLKFAAALPPGTKIGSVELVLPDAPQIAPLVLSAGTAQLEIVPVNLSGEATGQPERAAWPAVIKSPSQLSLYFDRGKFPHNPAATLVVLRDPAGAELALIRLQP